MEGNSPRAICCGVPIVWVRCGYWEDEVWEGMCVVQAGIRILGYTRHSPRLRQSSRTPQGSSDRPEVTPLAILIIEEDFRAWIGRGGRDRRSSQSLRDWRAASPVEKRHESRVPPGLASLV